MSNSLLSKKSSLTSRRNIIIYIMTTILILSVVAGFTNIFHTDNRRFAASWGETIVMEAEPPATGTPSDYDLLSNLEFTAYRIHNSKYFRGDTDGIVSADVGLGISYTQTLTNTRVVYDKNIVFTETISASSMKSLAEQKYADHGVIIYRGADKISGNKATFSSTARQMSYEDYSKKYGSVPNQLSKYIINKNTILSVKDENASTQKALNGTGDDEDDDDITFDVPDRLVPNADGNYVFTLTLDPLLSSLYYRNEVRTLGGADSNPKFYSVKITVTINSEWVPISTRTLENYDIEIPKLGPMNCNGNNYEVFTMVNDENGTIPEKDFFQPYVDKAKEDPNYVPPDIVVSGPLSPSDYLSSAFADYLSGSKNLDLKADIAIGDFKARDLKLSLNLNTLDIQAMLGNGLYVKYAGDKIYIKNNSINGYISTEDIKELTSDPELKGLLDGMTLDLNKIFGGNMLDVIFKDCEMTTENGVTTIPMSFALDLSDVIAPLDNVQINAAININDSDKSLKSIIGTVTIGDTAIDIKVQPLAKAPSFPSVDGAVDLSGILDFVPDIASTAMQKTYGIDGTLTLNDMKVGVSAYVDRTNGLKAEAVLNVLGLDVKVTYIDDVIYADALGVSVRGTAEELPDLLNALLELTDFNKYQNLLKVLLPSSVNDVVKMLKSIDVDGNTLSVGMEFIGIPINAKLTRGNGKLQSVALDVDVDLFDIVAKVNADLHLSEPKARELVAPVYDSYLTFTDLAELITQVKPYLSADYYTAAIDGYVEINGMRNDISGSFDIDKITDKDKSVTGVAAKGTLTLLGQDVAVTYVDNEAYVAIGNIKAKLNVTDIDSLIPSVMRLVNQITGTDELPEIDIADMVDGAVKSASMTDGTLNLVLSVKGFDITVTLNLENGKAEITASANGMTAKLNVTVGTAKNSHNISKPTGAYMNVAELTPMLDAAADIIEQKAITMPIAVTYDGNTYTATVEADFADGLTARVSVDKLGLEIVLIDNTVYLSLGNIKLCGNIEQAKELYAEISKHYALPTLDGILELLPQDADINGMLATALSAIGSLQLNGGVLNAEIAINGFGAKLALTTALTQITVNVDGIDVTMTPAVGCKQITVPDGDYNSISELTKFVPAVFELAQATAFNAQYSVSVNYGDGYDIGGTAVIDLANGVGVNATIDALGQSIKLAYVNDIVYFGLNTIKLKMSPADISAFMPSAQAILSALGIALPDSNDVTAQLKNSLTAETVENALLSGLASVKSLTVADKTITLGVEYGDYIATLTISVTDGPATATVNITLNELGALSATLCTSDSTVAAPEDEDAYIDVAELAPMLDKAADILTTRGIKATVKVTVDDMELAAAIECTIENGELKVSVKEDTLGLTVKLLGDTAYIDVGGIKVSGQLSDITELMDSVIPNLPDVICQYVAKMNEQMMGVIPSDDELRTDGKTDIAKTIDTVLSMLTSLTLNDGVITVGISRNALSATLNVSTDLSDVNGNIALTFNGIGGPFGDCYAMEFGMSVSGITASAVTVEPVVAEEYVKASTLIDALNCVLPLMKEKAFELNVNAKVFGQTVSGNVYIDLGDYTLQSISAKAVLDIAGANVIITLIDKTLYLDIKSDDNTAIKISQPLNKDALNDLIEQLEQELPELGLADKIGSLKDISATDIVISNILNKITLSPIDNGMALEIALDKATVNAEILMNGSVLSAVNVNCDLDGKTVTVALNVTTDENGVISGIKTTEINVMGTKLGLDLQIASAQQNEVTVDGDYLSAAELIPYISPVIALKDEATAAKSLTLTISAMTIEVMGKEIDVTGRVDVALDPIAVRATLILFADTTDDRIELHVQFTNNVLYLQIGKISLQFNITKDLSTLNAAIEPYMPKSLKNLKDLSALTTLFALFKNIQSIAEADGIDEIMSIMFSEDNAYGKSMIRQVVDMLRLGNFNDYLTASVTVMEAPFKVTVDVAPVLNNGELGSVRLGATVSNKASVRLTAGLDFSDQTFTVDPPYVEPEKPETAEGAEEAVSDDNSEKPIKPTPIVDFVTAVINAVNTLTAKAPNKVTYEVDENNNKTGVKTTVSQRAFEIDSFKFDYDIFRIETEVDADGNTVEATDEAGRPKIAKEKDENGKETENKIKEQTIKVCNVAGQDALKFALTTTTVTDENKDEDEQVISKSTELMIEAHIAIDIYERDKEDNFVKKTGFPIELNLYVKPTEDHPEGLAYLYYKEASGHGEKISIDYNSIMQLVASVLDILNVKNDIIDEMLGDYQLDIDKTVFESMSIPGLDKVSGMLNKLMTAVGEGKQALADLKAAWNRLQAAEDVDALIKEMFNDELDGEATIKALLDSAIDKVKDAIALFSSNDEKAEKEPEPETNKLNGALVGKVVNSVYFNSANSILSAYVDNSVATGTDGWAVVSVESAGDKISSIGVKNLDVNKAKLNEFDLQFTPVTSFITVDIPDDWKDEDNDKDSYKTMYSDLSNIKHLIFDVMNTANMLEFEIGGFDTDDGISISLHIGKLQLENVKIKLDAKVKILDRGKDANPRYSTAADIELHIPEMSVLPTAALNGIVLPECTTRLFFYDDVIYIVGQNWQYGTRKDNITRSWNSLINGIFWKTAEVQTAFTVSELSYMMKNDIEKFLTQFVFRLLPLSRCVNSIGDMDVQQTIIDSIKNEGKDENNTKNTLAQIFKSYQYNNGSHDIVIGLAELAGSTALSDVSLSLIGANDGDNNILDNYIQRLTVSTSLVSLIDVALDVSLRNVSTPTVYYEDFDFITPSKDNAKTEYYRNELESTGLSSTTINGTKYTIDGSTATVYSNRTPTGKDSNVKSLIDTILAEVTRNKAGKVTSVENRTGGIQWTRPWKDEYEASLTA